MDATEFFCQIIEPNYAEATRAPDDLRLLVNAIISMNTVAEFLALKRNQYGQMTRKELTGKANELRKQFPCLEDLKLCAETLKHVRKLNNAKSADFSLTATSTSISPTRTSTWTITTVSNTYHLRTIVDVAFQTIKTFPEFK
jgi:hypothetical protein